MDSKDVQKPLPEKWVNIFDLIEQMGEINYSNYKIFNNCINFSQHWKLIRRTYRLLIQGGDQKSG